MVLKTGAKPGLSNRLQGALNTLDKFHHDDALCFTQRLVDTLESVVGCKFHLLIALSGVI